MKIEMLRSLLLLGPLAESEKVFKISKGRVVKTVT